jgi:PAS domain S-box-containing protein
VGISNELARQLLDAASDPSIVIDPDGIVVYANARVRDVLGYEPAELVDEHMEVLLPERFRAIHPNHQAGYFSNPSPRPMGTGLELYALRKDGDEIPVEISLNPVTTAEGTLVFATLRDASEQKNLERELVEANRAKSRFLAAASHDLRQPIQALNLLNSVARKAVTEQARHTIIEKQQRSLDSMARLLNALLDISKLEAGIVKPDITDCAVEDIFADVRAEFEEQARDRGLELVIDECCDVARSDPRLLTQILENLVSNAIRYTREGLVRLRCLHEELSIRIEVLDTGLGISPDELDHIFEEFHQADTGASRPEGLGLGLSIVKRTAGLLGCELEVSSTVGKGSVFSVTVPRGNEESALASEPDRSSLPAVGGGRILIVDDEPAVTDATSMLLRLEGFEVLTAASESDALECASGQPLDLLITDYHLRGGATGLDVIRAVRDQIRFDVPVIVVSGDTSDRVVVADLEQTTFLTKPVDVDALLADIRRQIGSR